MSNIIDLSCNTFLSHSSFFNFCNQKENSFDFIKKKIQHFSDFDFAITQNYLFSKLNLINLFCKISESKKIILINNSLEDLFINNKRFIIYNNKLNINIDSREIFAILLEEDLSFFDLNFIKQLKKENPNIILLINRANQTILSLDKLFYINDNLKVDFLILGGINLFNYYEYGMILYNNFITSKYGIYFDTYFNEECLKIIANTFDILAFQEKFPTESYVKKIIDILSIEKSFNIESINLIEKIFIKIIFYNEKDAEVFYELLLIRNIKVLKKNENVFIYFKFDIKEEEIRKIFNIFVNLSQEIRLFRI